MFFLSHSNMLHVMSNFEEKRTSKKKQINFLKSGICSSKEYKYKSAMASTVPVSDQ
jgi:hypothetical protein